MFEAWATKFATLHLEGEVHEWWYHGLITMEHSSITSCVDLAPRLINRFDRKYLEIQFKELAQLQQTGTPAAYISEFQRVAVMVTDISAQRLIMLFTKGLARPLCGWIKAFKPTTLRDAITRT